MDSDIKFVRIFTSHPLHTSNHAETSRIYTTQVLVIQCGYHSVHTFYFTNYILLCSVLYCRVCMCVLNTLYNVHDLDPIKSLVSCTPFRFANQKEIENKDNFLKYLSIFFIRSFSIFMVGMYLIFQFVNNLYLNI